MSPFATVGVAWRSLWRYPLRTTLASIGIVCGVAAVVAMVAAGRGAQREVDGWMRALGSNVLLLAPTSRRTAGVYRGEGSWLSLTEDDAHAVGTQVDDILAAAPVVNGRVQLVAAARNWSTVIYGTTNAFFAARDWVIAAGRAFDDDELAAGAKVIVLGQRVARELFGPEMPFEAMLGATVRIKAVPFLVIGVLEAKGQHIGGSDADDRAMVPLAAARMRLFGSADGRAGRVQTVVIRVAHESAIPRVQSEVRALLRQRHRTPPNGEDRFSVTDLTEHIVASRAARQATSTLLAAVAGIGLLIGGVGIMNLMLVSVTERTREIGLRMALGARNRDILAQFLVEAVVLSTIGGVGGVVAGVGLAELVARHLGSAPIHDPSTFVAALGVAASVGLAAGVYPAWRAARLQPVAALAHE